MTSSAAGHLPQRWYFVNLSGLSSDFPNSLGMAQVIGYLGYLGHLDETWWMFQWNLLMVGIFYPNNPKMGVNDLEPYPRTVAFENLQLWLPSGQTWANLFACFHCDLGAPAPAPCVAWWGHWNHWKSVSDSWSSNMVLGWSTLVSLSFIPSQNSQQYWLKFHVQNRSSKYHLFFFAPRHRKFGPFTHSRGDHLWPFATHPLCRPCVKIDTLDSDSPALNQSTQAMSKLTSDLGPDSSNKTACLEISWNPWCKRANGRNVPLGD